MKFIHISDLHFCTAPHHATLEPGLGNSQRAVADIKARFPDAEFGVATGDIVADPDEGAYQLAAETFANMPFPMHFIPGNHDGREMAKAFLPGMKDDGNGFLQKVERFSFGVGVFLDTVKEGFPGGTYCAQRQEWLREQLRQHDGEPLWIFLHHAPFATGLVAMDDMGMDAASSQQLAAVLRTHSGPKHLFCGHYHRAFSGTWQGMAFSCVPSMIVQVGLELSDSAKAGIIFEPPQYAVVLADDQRTIVHYHQFASGLPSLPIP